MLTILGEGALQVGDLRRAVLRHGEAERHRGLGVQHAGEGRAAVGEARPKGQRAAS